MIDPLLEELQKDSRTSPARLAELFNMEESDVRDRIRAWEKDGTILGYNTVIDPEKAEDTGVAALIEVRLTPERDGGFNRTAKRIAEFSQVRSCYLMSGSYDLAVMVNGETLQEVARFVAEKLSSLPNVLSTATHFQLKVYKQNGFLNEAGGEQERLPVTP